MSRAWVAWLLAAAIGVTVHAAPPPSIPEDSLPAIVSLDAIPLGLDLNRPVPEDNPLTEAKVRLGRKLFFDPILSADGSVACASCHQPAHGFAGPSPVAVGIHGKQGTRKAPSLLNRAFGESFFWDGREGSLEAQALRPIASPAEMGSSVASAVERLRAHKEYAAQFQAAFADGVNSTNLARALASFERLLLNGDSRIDRFRAGDLQALTDNERHGLWLYESRAGCWRCHSGANFTDEGYHNTGVGWGKTPPDYGRHAVTRQESDRGRFKTPSLRGVAATAPYMHDGSMATLDEVVEFYNRGGGKNSHVDSALKPLGLSRADTNDLVAFLKALSNAATKENEKQGHNTR